MTIRGPRLSDARHGTQHMSRPLRSANHVHTAAVIQVQPLRRRVRTCQTSRTRSFTLKHAQAHVQVRANYI